MYKKGQIVLFVLISLIGIIIITVLFIIGMYNGLVNKDVAVKNAFSKIQSALQRRADLIPNLVETVKGAKDFEQETQTKIAELRSQAGQIQQQVQSATTSTHLQQAGTEMDSVLSRLLVIVESYPDLKATQNFLSLQDELAGTENRIKFERDNYNDAVQTYETATRKFPTNIFAGMFGFTSDRYNMFQAAEGSEQAPKVGF